ncbi:hypothetical protein ACIQWR_40820 [Streptomyces sp. NPDC098789]|uniref:hypothetical protein n=1 Tax=Streptomyces sp. NPDC098789 TaxID=3366098 RepID=UPI0038158808
MRAAFRLAMLCPAVIAIITVSVPVANAETPLEPRQTITDTQGGEYVGIELQGLHVEQLTMWPAGQPVKFWALVLDDDEISRSRTGGVFFVYAPASGDHGHILDTDIIVDSVPDAERVVIADPSFLRAHPRTEIRYGDPSNPESAEVVATATVWI